MTCCDMAVNSEEEGIGRMPMRRVGRWRNLGPGSKRDVRETPGPSQPDTEEEGK